MGVVVKVGCELRVALTAVCDGAIPVRLGVGSGLSGGDFVDIRSGVALDARLASAGVVET